MSAFTGFFQWVVNLLKSGGLVYTGTTIWIVVGNFLGLYLYTGSPNLLIDFGQVVAWALAIFL